jgi:uncharacterized membrane protein
MRAKATGRKMGRKRYRTNTQDLDWQEEQAAFQGRRNIGELQRLLSILTGTGLLVRGISKRTWSGAGLCLLGAVLIHRGAGGYCAALDAIGVGSQSTNLLGRRKVKTDQATKIRRTIEINRPPRELYRFWRSLENLPRVMSHLESVQVINDRLSHWVVKTMAGFPRVEWDAEIINDVENERIGWRSLRDADVDNAGSVDFEPIGDGSRTELTVTLQYAPPAGRLGTAVAELIGEDPGRKIDEDLRRFKEEMEAGTRSSQRA